MSERETCKKEMKKKRSIHINILLSFGRVQSGKIETQSTERKMYKSPTIPLSTD